MYMSCVLWCSFSFAIYVYISFFVLKKRITFSMNWIPFPSRNMYFKLEMKRTKPHLNKIKKTLNETMDCLCSPVQQMEISKTTFL